MNVCSLHICWQEILISDCKVHMLGGVNGQGGVNGHMQYYGHVIVFLYQEHIVK